MSYGLIYYLITIVGGVDGYTTFLTIVLTMTFLVTFIAMLISTVEGGTRLISTCKRVLKALVIPLCIATTLTLILPSKKDLVIILGLHLGTQSIDEAVKIPPKLLELLNSELDGLLDKKKD